jgi:hypothetical protein
MCRKAKQASVASRRKRASVPCSTIAPLAHVAWEHEDMKHVFSVVGLGLAVVSLVVFFTGRIDSKQLPSVAPRVGMEPHELDGIVARISSRTGATVGTSRRVVYFLACSGVPTRSTMESQALAAADITEKQRMTAKEATLLVLSGSPSTQASEGAPGPLRDC